MAKCLINNTGNKGANGVMIQVLNFFVEKGYTPTQACAIAGNVFGESSYNPSSKNELGCIGLFQWCFSRKDKVIAAYGDPGWKNVNNQLNYVWKELSSGGERESVGNYFSKYTGKTLSEYTYHWLRYFETPTTDEDKLRKTFLPTRLEYAKKAAAVYNQMNKGECVVDESSSGGGGNGGGFSCDDTDVATSDISIVDSSTSQVYTSQSNGTTDTSGNAKNQTVDTRPLFVGDSWAIKIYNNCDSMKQNWRLLALQRNGTMEAIAHMLKSKLSSPLLKPRFIVVYCGDDNKLQRNTGSMFTTGSKDLVASMCRKIVSAAPGIKIYFCQTVMDSIYYKCKESDFYYTASSVLNKALKQVYDEGFSVDFNILNIPQDPTRNVILKYTECIPSEKRTTLKPHGFIALGSYIYLHAK